MVSRNIRIGKEIFVYLLSTAVKTKKVAHFSDKLKVTRSENALITTQLLQQYQVLPN